ncbi:MAG: hypothetical protein V1899_05900, partial [Planctomycetota bacterium]
GGSSGGSNVIGSGGALGVTLSPTAATHVTVTASNPFGDVGATTQNITWAATDLKGKSFSADTLRIRKGDSLLLTASGAGKKLTIAVVVQASGLPPDIVFSGAPGNRFAYRYDTPGVYVAQAWIDAQAVGSLTVIVIEVNMNKDLASQVLFERINDITKDMTINPINPISQISPISPINQINQVTQLPAIWFGSNDATLLKAFTTSANGTTSLHLRPLKRGNQYVLARLNGSTGPLLALRKVWEFTIDTPALEYTVINAETGIGTTTLTVRPHIPNVDFNFLMSGHTSTFAGGKTAFTINTSASQSSIGEPGFQSIWNATTGETDGRFRFDMEMPAGESLYCFTMQPTQDGTSSGAVSSRGKGPVPVGEKGLINGKECEVEVHPVTFRENDPRARRLVAVVTKAGKPDKSGKSNKYPIKILSPGQPVEPFFTNGTTTSTGLLDTGVEGSKIDEDVKSGNKSPLASVKLYNVKIGDTEFAERVVVVPAGQEDIFAMYQIREQMIDLWKRSVDVNQEMGGLILKDANGDYSFNERPNNKPANEKETQYGMDDFFADGTPPHLMDDKNGNHVVDPGEDMGEIFGDVHTHQKVDETPKGFSETDINAIDETGIPTTNGFVVDDNIPPSAMGGGPGVYNYHAHPIIPGDPPHGPPSDPILGPSFIP